MVVDCERKTDLFGWFLVGERIKIFWSLWNTVLMVSLGQFAFFFFFFFFGTFKRRSYLDRNNNLFYETETEDMTCVVLTLNF